MSGVGAPKMQRSPVMLRLLCDVLGVQQLQVISEKEKSRTGIYLDKNTEWLSLDAVLRLFCSAESEN